jgi:hypothetical protein
VPWAAFLCLWSVSVAVQTTQGPPARAYQANIADEDWSFLADPAQRKDLFDPIKYISFREGRSYLTLGGEARIRPEGLRLRGAPGTPNYVDNYAFQRYLFAADLHLGKRARIYGELQSGLINGKFESPRPTDKNVADIHQAFVEYHSPRDRARQVLVRVGRQEMSVGSSRLISASQGLNVKRSFDGVSGTYRAGPWRFEGGAARLVAVSGGAFDDVSSGEQKFWGTSVQRTGFVMKSAAGGLYYLGVDRKLSIYTQGTGAEIRHTFGGKFAGAWKAWEFNFDVIGQWGEFAGAPARAWATAIENAVRVRSWPWRPRFMLRVNSASGDRDPADPRLESFDPLFPGAAYSGLVGLLGPTNLTDVTPSVQLIAPRRIVIVFEVPSYFRTSVRDGVYNISLRPLPIPATNPGRYVGSNPAVVAVWNATPHVSLTGVITRFLPGSFTEGTFLAHGFGFYSSTFTFRF